jgi:hypothetical protein
MKKVDMTAGARFGRLVIIKEVERIILKPRAYVRRFLCRCDCGEEKVVSGYKLRNGSTRSCGCLKHNRGDGVTNKSPQERLYIIWNCMKQRCRPNSKKYRKNYFDRGIAVCPEWLNNFNAFYEWAVSNGYSPTLSIDRINNNKGYSPDNCRWATSKQQMNNVRYNVFLTAQGETHTLAEWSDILCVPYGTLYTRKRNGWNDEKIITTPVQKRITKKSRNKQ